MNDEIDRTKPLGLFNYARSYWRSAEYLNTAQLKLTHPTAPVCFLFYHAMELYLKSFLRSQSLSLGSLKAIGHRLDKAGEKAIEHGLVLADEDKEVLNAIGDSDTVINARYIVTGAFSRPAEEALSRTCLSLDNSIGKKLIEQGIPVREDAIDPSIGGRAVPPKPDFEMWRHREKLTLLEAAQLWSGARPSITLGTKGSIKDTYAMLSGAIQKGELKFIADGSIAPQARDTLRQMQQQNPHSNTQVTRTDLKVFARLHGYDPEFLRE